MTDQRGHDADHHPFHAAQQGDHRMNTSWVHDQTVSCCRECPYVILAYAEESRMDRADCGFFCDSQMSNTRVSHEWGDPPPSLCPLREGPVTLKIAEGV